MSSRSYCHNFVESNTNEVSNIITEHIRLSDYIIEITCFAFVLNFPFDLSLFPSIENLFFSFFLVLSDFAGLSLLVLPVSSFSFSKKLAIHKIINSERNWPDTFERLYRVQYFRGRIPNLKQSEVRKRFLLVSYWSKFGTLPKNTVLQIP